MKYIQRYTLLVGMLCMFTLSAFADEDVPTGHPEAGKVMFDHACVYCHAADGGDKFGPSLKGVGERRSVAWLNDWLKNPSEMIKNDVDAKVVRGKSKYNLTMPALPDMQDAQKRADVIAYLLSDF